ncbi:HAD family hydrolase [Desulfosediminicola flagellatus]|uniref:HAD family hydrolase n=1 Tax=Desulfosediminicola flagellatus TaxID=2569541 RepID=UPI0010AD1C58|nr:HAD family hydrolase [Desulfosediminicola flagellatus]
MLQIDIPGQNTFILKHLVLDYNGTIAEDGELIIGVSSRLIDLSNSLTIHVITADTHGTVMAKLAGLPVKTTVIGEGTQDKHKEEFVKQLGVDSVIAMGNGRNDIHMLSAAAIGVGLMQKEGCAAAVSQSSDVLCNDICDALDLLRFPDRLRATLRN